MYWDERAYHWFKGQMKNNVCHHLAFDCHVPISDVVPEMCMEEMKEGGDRGLTYCGWQQHHVLSPSDNNTWLLLHCLCFRVDGGGWEEDCGLHPSQTLLFANVQFECNQATAYLADAGLFSFDGSMA